MQSWQRAVVAACSRGSGTRSDLLLCANLAALSVASAQAVACCEKQKARDRPDCWHVPASLLVDHPCYFPLPLPPCVPPISQLEFEAGQEIIKQGDKGDKFYVLDEGTCDISIAGKGSVLKATKGIAFGELALLHNAPRAATVTTESMVTAWYIDELTFKSILMGKSKQDSEDYQTFLKGVPILKGLDDAQITELAGCLKEAEYAAGKIIIAEGDEGNSFFIIRDGEVKCTKSGKSDEVSRRLKRGDFFGELALLSADKRQASVTAVGDTTVLMIARAEFTRLLGSLSDIIETSTQYSQLYAQ